MRGRHILKLLLHLPQSDRLCCQSSNPKSDGLWQKVTLPKVLRAKKITCSNNALECAPAPFAPPRAASLIGEAGVIWMLADDLDGETSLPRGIAQIAALSQVFPSTPDPYCRAPGAGALRDSLRLRGSCD